MSRGNILTEDDLYDLLSFLVSSALGLINEPKLYGPQRLIDAGCRLIQIALESGQLEDEHFLREFKEEADAGKFLAVSGEEVFTQYLEDATRKLAREMKRRASTQ